MSSKEPQNGSAASLQQDGAIPPSETRDLAMLALHEEEARVPSLAKPEYAELRRDVERRGVLEPLAITPSGVILDGRARLQAARDLGHDRIPVRPVAVEDELAYMLRAAITRRQLSPSQKAALAVELCEYEEIRAAAAAERRRRNLRQNAEEATLPPRGKTRDQVAEIAGASARTVQDVITIREHDRELFKQVKDGEIAAHRAARRIRRLQRDSEVPPPPPLPEGPFDVVYADPPWRLGNPDGPYAPENHYPTMLLCEIKMLAVPAADDSVLFLWAVNCLVPEALEVMQAWGFRYVTNLVWVKPSIGLGRWVRNRHELVLVGRMGSFPAPELEDLANSVIEAPRGRHSEKPAFVRQAIERGAKGATHDLLASRRTQRYSQLIELTQADRMCTGPCVRAGVCASKPHENGSYERVSRSYQRLAKARGFSGAPEGLGTRGAAARQNQVRA